jgi:hypothetical protein
VSCAARLSLSHPENQLDVLGLPAGRFGFSSFSKPKLACANFSTLGLCRAETWQSDDALNASFNECGGRAAFPPIGDNEWGRPDNDYLYRFKSPVSAPRLIDGLAMSSPWIGLLKHAAFSLLSPPEGSERAWFWSD